MKPLVQKLPLEELQSFVARTYRTPNFEVGWHQHVEIELILFSEGAGMSFIGNHVGEFNTGDCYLLGKNLPHTFQKTGDQITSAVVVQFRDNIWGDTFLHMPECKEIAQLLHCAGQGLKIGSSTALKLNPLIRKLEIVKGFERLSLLLECLSLIAYSGDCQTVASGTIQSFNSSDRDCIDRVFQFTIDHFKEPLPLSSVAAVACLSIPAFCQYFKRRTQKTFIDFLNEVRIGYACNQLLETHLPVIEICYDSGYNTMAHFHRQFLKLRGLTPLQYRKTFHPEIIGRGKMIGIAEPGGI